MRTSTASTSRTAVSASSVSCCVRRTSPSRSSTSGLHPCDERVGVVGDGVEPPERLLGAVEQRLDARHHVLQPGHEGEQPRGRPRHDARSVEEVTGAGETHGDTLHHPTPSGQGEGVRTLSTSALTAALSALPAPGPEGPRVVVAGNHAVPWEALRTVDEALPAYRLFMLNAPTGVPQRQGVVLETPFVGAGMRDAAQLDYVPARLSLVPTLFGTTRVPDVVVLHVSAPQDGTVSMGTEVNVLPAAVEAVRARGGLVLAQVDRSMPYTYGDGVLALEEVDLALEADAPMSSPRLREPDDVSRAIGERVASLVHHGATLQLGIGGVPDAVLASLVERKGLRVWTEMVSDGILALERAGALDPDATLTTSFLFGSQDLYEWVDRNPRVRVLRTETTNDPSMIAKQKKMTSINTALQVDLFAQANASRRPDRPGRVYSGFGGQTDFIVGALHSPGGRAVIALPSVHAKAGVSTVVPLLEAPATSFQHSHIVSEQGAAQVWGCGATEQAQQLVDAVAHPSVRDELRERGRALGLALR
ncbi:MAG TPA: acetyl-CoA hydrolase/transferase C-terminal domain-containing protein [Mycobacteriales bacterium]|nr:acetyl-CoA hydrolase/transferase C-terminal domain-containing protein [Mycobacteriales bacterium]